MWNYYFLKILKIEFDNKSSTLFSQKDAMIVDKQEAS